MERTGKMSIKSICFIADGYPSEQRVVNAFVETLVNQITDLGVECVVIAPQSVSRFLKKNIKPLPYKRQRFTNLGNAVTVYSPKYLSVSTTRVGLINTSKLTLNNFMKAAIKCFDNINEEHSFDAVYGHFIFESGITANAIGKQYGIPAFFAYGENTTYTIDYLGEKATKKLLEGVTGAISVSSENKRILTQYGLVNENDIGVFPNAADSRHFHYMDKSQCRAKYGFPANAFIVAFTGRFIDVKGPDRLAKALDCFDDVYSIFIGEGPVEPSCKNILFKGTVSHNSIGELLSTSDLFVLPTLAEGCCNAVIEALACGLPVVSSNLPFNDDILNDECSVRVDPNSVDEIVFAINKLKNDPELLDELSRGALKIASNLTIENRANRILDFMNEKVLEEKSND